MAYCPSCAAELPADASRCAKCNAVFGDGWNPLPSPPKEPAPSVPRRAFLALVKLFLVAIGGAALYVGGFVTAPAESDAWRLAAYGAVGALVVAAALRVRVRWMLGVTLLTLPFALPSCVAKLLF